LAHVMSGRYFGHMVVSDQISWPRWTVKTSLCSGVRACSSQQFSARHWKLRKYSTTSS